MSEVTPAEQGVAKTPPFSSETTAIFGNLTTTQLFHQLCPFDMTPNLTQLDLYNNTKKAPHLPIYLHKKVVFDNAAIEKLAESA